MNTVDIITKKRNGGKLTDEEIIYLVDGYTSGNIPDYQISAFLMAVYFRGMTEDETVTLTKVMRDSGDVIDLSAIEGIKVDKHSTGGVGDKTKLIDGPIAAACGVPIAKMSGRGLGFTGGTVDKLEAIPGYRTELSREEFMGQVNSCGISLIGQTGHIAPADKKIYALRDVTATVENLSLITSSIMSKKLASGSDAIVLDVKCGKGAFMKDEASARMLADLMVKIGNASGRKTMAVITDMNQPLGKAVGNTLEVIEAIETLKGQGPDDITELSLELAALMIYAGEKANTIDEARALSKRALESGAALDKLRELIRSQGGDERVIDDYDILPSSGTKYDVAADRNGFISEIDAMCIGIASQHTGAGRESKEDVIDPGAGITLCRKVGDPVHKGDIIAKVYTEKENFGQILEEVQNSIKISDKQTLASELIKQYIII